MENKTVQKFMSSIPKESKVSVIIPLYGYWKGLPVEQLNEETLKASLYNLKSSSHKLYFIFVAETKRLSKGLMNVLAGVRQAGNFMGVDVGEGSSYNTYLWEGLTHAIENTDSQYFIVMNPWIMLQEDSIDQMLERVNRKDVALASGFDVKPEVSPENFLEFKYNLPKEMRELSLDFLGMTRAIAESLQIDSGFKTHFFLAADFWRMMYAKGYEVVTSQFLPIYSFDIDWSLIEKGEDFESDKNHFLTKWKFDPNVKYA